MKKILAIVLAMAMLLCFASCGNTEEESDGFMENPMVDYEELASINETCGTNLVKVPVMGVSDEAFYVVAGDLADYRFSVAGRNYVFRGSKDMDDISGIYEDGDTIFADASDELTYYFSDNYAAARFVIDDVQYVIETSRTGEAEVTEEYFKGVVEEIMSVMQ